MQKLAKELGMVIPVSFFEEANNAHYNSIVVIDADGTDLGLYRKSHIPDGPGSKRTYSNVLDFATLLLLKGLLITSSYTRVKKACDANPIVFILCCRVSGKILL